MKLAWRYKFRLWFLKAYYLSASMKFKLSLRLPLPSSGCFLDIVNKFIAYKLTVHEFPKLQLDTTKPTKGNYMYVQCYDETFWLCPIFVSRAWFRLHLFRVIAYILLFVKSIMPNRCVLQNKHFCNSLPQKCICLYVVS